MIDFSKYITERTRDFTGRTWVFQAIDVWLSTPDGPRFFLLTGEPGSGKSAIAARLAQFSQGAASPPDGVTALAPGFLSAVHFCSARDRRWINPHVFAESLALQLAAHFRAYGEALAQKREDRQIRIEVDQRVGEVAAGGQVAGVIIKRLDVSGISAEDAFVRVVREPLEALFRADSHESVVILIDALDEALLYSGRVGIVALLAHAEHLPPGVRFILTSRRDERVEREFLDADGLLLSATEFGHRNQEDVELYVVARLREDESLVTQVAAWPQAQVRASAAGIAAKAAGNFLYASFLLDAMARGQRALHEVEGLPEGLDGLYHESLDRVVRLGGQRWSTAYAPLLGVLSVAQAALSRARLETVTGQSEEALWQHLGDLQQFVEEVERGTDQTGGDYGYQLYHQSVADFLQRPFLTLPNKRLRNRYYLPAKTWHRRIADSYWETFHDNWQHCDDYGLRYLPVHLVKAGQDQTLRTLLLDFNWIWAKLDATDAAALIADYDLLAGDSDLALVQGALRLAAHNLGADKTQLPGQLVGRLLPYQTAAIQALLEQTKCWQETLWLRPLLPSLTPPVGPLMRTLVGHAGPVHAVAVTPDGKRIISASGDRTLKVWNLADGSEMLTLHGHTDSVRAVAVTRDGTRAVSASDDATLRVWDLERGTELRPPLRHVSHISDILAVAVMPDDRRALSASKHGSLVVWDLPGGTPLSVLHSPDENPERERWQTWVEDKSVNGVAVTPDGRYAVAACNDTTLKIWDLECGVKLRTLYGHAGSVIAVAVIPKSQQIISAAIDHTLKVWDLTNGAELLTLGGHTLGVLAVAVTEDGQRAVSASEDATLKVWDLKSGAELGTMSGHTFWVEGVALTTDGTYAASASGDGTLKVWNLRLAAERPIFAGHTGPVTRITTTPDSRRAISASEDNTLRIWNLDSGTEEHILAGHDGWVNAAVVTPDGRHAVSASEDSTLRVWELAKGRCIRTLRGHNAAVNCVVVTPDGQHAVSAAGNWYFSSDNTLMVWKLNSGVRLRTLRGHTSRVSALALTPDGRHAVSASEDTTLKVWELVKGRELRTLHGHTKEVGRVVVTPDGRRVISASLDRTVKVWDLASGRELDTLRGDGAWVEAIAVTRDNRWLIAGFADGRIKVWDLVNRVEYLSRHNHSDRIADIAIAASGQWFISASLDHTLSVWDLTSGKCRSTFAGEHPLRVCAITPDERTILVGEVSGRVHILRLEGTSQLLRHSHPQQAFRSK